MRVLDNPDYGHGTVWSVVADLYLLSQGILITEIFPDETLHGWNVAQGLSDDVGRGLIGYVGI